MNWIIEHKIDKYTIDDMSNWVHIRYVGTFDTEELALRAAWEYFIKWVWTDPNMHVTGKPYALYAEVADDYCAAVFVNEEDLYDE